ncbi:MAG: VWA domain-containing protein [bacterium]|nr:VWA domain-containing protein [bacterium]
MKLTPKSVWLAAILVFLTPFATAQQSAPEEGSEKSTIQPIGGLEFVDEIDVTVANVIVHVTDDDGSPITTLTKDDFKVFLDGHEHKITNFQLFTKEMYQDNVDEPRLHGLDMPDEEVTEPEEEIELNRINIVLYVDNENLHPMDRNRVLNRVHDFVRDNLRPPVQMMVASFEKYPDIIQPFTSDVGEVLSALRSLRTYSGGFEEREDTRDELFDHLDRLQEEQRRGSGTFRQRDLYDALGRVQSFAREQFVNLSYSLDGLRTVATSITGVPGKKTIVYIANGLPMTPGLDLFQAYSDMFNQPSVVNQSTMYAQTNSFRALVSAANAAGISYYTIGAGGLEVTHGVGAGRRSPAALTASMKGRDNMLNSLRYIAEGTGGRALVDSNDFLGGLERVGHDMFTFYSLGYPLSRSGSDKVHKVKIELPNHSDLEVRYRRRFVEKSMETQTQDKVISALLYDVDENPFGIQLTSDKPTQASEERWMQPAKVSFPLESIALLPEGEEYVGRVIMFLAARDSDGGQSDIVRKEHEIRIPAADYEVAKTQLFSISSRLLLESGSYRLAVALFDPITRQSSLKTIRTRVGKY